MDINLNAIGVDRKEAHFTQIYNQPVQKDLKDLGAIGLLTYILSLPDDWKIYKTHLHNEFSRRRVESAWKVLVEKCYAIDLSFYIKGKKGRLYFYRVSDEPYTQEKFTTIVRAVVKSLTEAGNEVNLETVETNNSFELPEEISNVQNVQYNLNSTKRTSTKKDITKKQETKKHITNTDSISIDNLQEPENTGEESLEKETELSEESLQPSPEEIWTVVCNEFYNEFAIGRWSKKQWNTLVKKFVTDTIENGRHLNVPDNKIRGYVYRSLERIAENSSYKQFLKEWAENGERDEEEAPIEEVTDQDGKPKFYNWLEDRDE